MRKLLILCLAVVALTGCKKDDDPTFASAAGNWTYATPDGKIGIDFTISESDALSVPPALIFSNQVIRVEGVAGKAEIQVLGENQPTITSIRINANDSKLTYAYAIEFTNLTISSDFKQINVASATYTWPHDKTNSLTNIAITRK